MNRFCLYGLGLLMRHNCALALSAAKRFSGHKQGLGSSALIELLIRLRNQLNSKYAVVCFSPEQTNMLGHK